MSWIFLSLGDMKVHRSDIMSWQKVLVRIASWTFFLTFFLICRRARRQRSQSPILVTVRIDKHFKLYIDWSLSGKSKSSQLASHVMESTSRFLLIAQSAIRKAATLQSSYSRTATTHDCKNMQMKSQHWVAPNCTCRRAFNCKQPQCSNCIRLTS